MQKYYDLMITKKTHILKKKIWTWKPVQLLAKIVSFLS